MTTPRLSYEAIGAALDTMSGAFDKEFALLTELAWEARGYLSGRRYLEAQRIVADWRLDASKRSSVRFMAIIAEGGWTAEEYSAEASRRLRAWLDKRQELARL